ncbi:MAG: type III pantothenate kinase [candidate division WOR-3 bacterium]|jgi:pantothenate kinase type III
MVGILDIGNANFHCGKFEKSSLKEKGIVTDPTEVKKFFSGMRQILCISVVPAKKKLIENILDYGMISFPSGLVEIDYKSKPGEDRLANGLGVYDLIGLPAIVVDCGSAITIDSYSKPSDSSFLVKFEGGAIMPGLKQYYFSVSDAGYLLPSVQPSFWDMPGKSTEEGIKLGAFGSLVGGIKEILRILNYKDKHLIFTGGDGKLFSEYFDGQYEQSLTLKGGLVAYNEIS